MRVKGKPHHAATEHEYGNACYHSKSNCPIRWLSVSIFLYWYWWYSWLHDCHILPLQWKFLNV